MDFTDLFNITQSKISVGDPIVEIKTLPNVIKVYPGEVLDINSNGDIKYETNIGKTRKWYTLYTNPAEIPSTDDGSIIAPYSMYEDHQNISEDSIELEFKSLRFGDEALVPTEFGFARCDHDNLKEVQVSRAKSASAFKLSGNLGEEHVYICENCQKIQF